MVNEDKLLVGTNESTALFLKGGRHTTLC